jgi:bifunctional non-homologous end joining protein LigD
MLATNRPLDDRHIWRLEPKLDGWRALVYVDGGVRVRTRSGRNVTESLPELAGIAEQVPDGTVLDGELIAEAGRGIDFYAVMPSMAARRRRAPLAFVCFDVPHLACESTIGLSYRQRRHLLELLELNGPAWCTVPSFDADADEMLGECGRLRLEGLVAKRVDSLYESGQRSRAWVKVKCSEWREHHAPLRHDR